MKDFWRFWPTTKNKAYTGRSQSWCRSVGRVKITICNWDGGWWKWLKWHSWHTLYADLDWSGLIQRTQTEAKQPYQPLTGERLLHIVLFFDHAFLCWRMLETWTAWAIAKIAADSSTDANHSKLDPSSSSIYKGNGGESRCFDMLPRLFTLSHRKNSVVIIDLMCGATDKRICLVIHTLRGSPLRLHA